MHKQLGGVLPPVITPFSGQELDLGAYRDNLALWETTGLSGYLVLGSNGESVYLDDDEGERLVAATRETVAGQRVVMVGTGRESTRATIAFTRRVARAGADCALVVTPYYFKAHMTPQRLRDHFTAVAEDSPIPILLYNVPQFTGVNMDPPLVAALAEHENIVGIKDSSGNIGQMGAMLRLVPEDFAVFTGNAGAFYPSLALGAKGGILALANVAPRQCVRIYQACQQGDHDTARQLQLAVGRLGVLTTVTYGVGGLKAAMAMAGYHPGGVRSPLSMPNGQAEQDLAQELKALGLLQGA